MLKALFQLNLHPIKIVADNSIPQNVSFFFYMIHSKPNEPAEWSGVLSQQCRQWLAAIPLPLEINNSLSLMYIFYTSLELTWLDEAGGGHICISN